MHDSVVLYEQVFNHSLRRSLPDQHLAKRLNNIINTLTLNVYNYACTGETLLIYHYKIFIMKIPLGLFEVHKLLFSFAMTTKIQEVESSLNHEELDFFIKVDSLHGMQNLNASHACTYTGKHFPRKEPSSEAPRLDARPGLGGRHETHHYTL